MITANFSGKVKLTDTSTKDVYEGNIRFYPNFIRIADDNDKTLITANTSSLITGAVRLKVNEENVTVKQTRFGSVILTLASKLEEV